MSNVLILYASTSGSTRFVVRALAEELRLADTHVEVYDIATLQRAVGLGMRHLIVLVTPTYGTGEWHSAWEQKGAMLLSELAPGARVALVALGDSRGHGGSFAGGLAKLAALVRSKRGALVGSVSAADYSFQSSPALEAGWFPGLVVEYRRNRHYAISRAQEWLKSLMCYA